MWLGIIIGAIMVVISSIIGEVRVSIERLEKANLLETISIKDDELDKKTAQINDMRSAIKDMSDASGELIHDYSIIAKILEDEIGREEAWRRYEEKKNGNVKDLNELINEIKAERENTNE
jgi:hypothetical protein